MNEFNVDSELLPTINGQRMETANELLYWNILNNTVLLPRRPKQYQ